MPWRCGAWCRLGARASSHGSGCQFGGLLKLYSKLARSSGHRGDAHMQALSLLVLVLVLVTITVITLLFLLLCMPAGPLDPRKLPRGGLSHARLRRAGTGLCASPPLNPHTAAISAYKAYGVV